MEINYALIGKRDADSLDLFQIINDIEDEFDVSVENPEEIVTVKDAVDFVESHK